MMIDYIVLNLDQINRRQRLRDRTDEEKIA
jgi:hypothetical protein